MLKFFQKSSEVLAALSEREDGSMKLTADELNSKNRNKFFERLEIGSEKVISAGIANSARAEIVSNDSPKIIYGTDALITTNENIFLSITVADCIPVYFYEPDQKILALAHAGWRGIVGGIIINTLKKISELGGQAENLLVALGPGIDKCHFEIKEDVLEKFSERPEFIERREGKIFVDLKGIIKKQLNEAGIKTENIESNPDCTFENERYFSFRRDKPAVVEAMLVIIGIK